MLHPHASADMKPLAATRHLYVPTTAFRGPPSTRFIMLARPMRGLQSARPLQPHVEAHRPRTVSHANYDATHQLLAVCHTTRSRSKAWSPVNKYQPADAWVHVLCGGVLYVTLRSTVVSDTNTNGVSHYGKSTSGYRQRYHKRRGTRMARHVASARVCPYLDQRPPGRPRY